MFPLTLAKSIHRSLLFQPILSLFYQTKFRALEFPSYLIKPDFFFTISPPTSLDYFLTFNVMLQLSRKIQQFSWCERISGLARQGHLDSSAHTTCLDSKKILTYLTHSRIIIHTSDPRFKTIFQGKNSHQSLFLVNAKGVVKDHFHMGSPDLIYEYSLEFVSLSEGHASVAAIINRTLLTFVTSREQTLF